MRSIKRKGYLVTGLVLAVALVVGIDATYGAEKKKIEMADAAKITINEAIKTASEKLAGKIIEAELEWKHDKVVWEVEIVTAENKIMEIHIDAETGAVIDVEEEKEKPKRKRTKTREHTN
ncbi:MAG: PepSY domain-containing protein [Nitrospira sp.]|nr:PepSY domain-containing protein [Nitrospira sp.]